jgi:DNA sulfur modification protein DndC
MIEERLAYISNEFDKWPSRVYVGFSGGKDSSAVVKLLYTAAKKAPQKAPEVEVVYCDTGVENPVIDSHVKKVLRQLEQEARSGGVKFKSRIIEPELDQGFFVRLIGRGYPPPTNSFRWCTKDVRIRPFRRFLREQNEAALIAIGTRMGESRQRDRSLRKSGTSGLYQRQRDGFAGAVLFTPVLDFDLFDVWEALVSLTEPRCISAERLSQLYKDGSGECPAIRDFKDKPCSRARFGCWTCTVVRRDRSAEGMIKQGYDELVPYLRFRQWLLDIRNNPQYRCRHRRNGQVGLGPFNLRARKMILGELEELEGYTRRPILRSEQRRRILELWELDLADERYLASE